MNQQRARRSKVLFVFDRFFLFFVAAASIGCGVPNLETPDCTAARTTIREFYSFHFGNEMHFSADELNKRRRFLSPGLVSQLSTAPAGADPFTTGTEDFPKAFRAGECKEVSAGRLRFNVLLFWKDDVRTEQKAIKVEMLKLGDGWVVDKIER